MKRVNTNSKGRHWAMRPAAIALLTMTMGCGTANAANLFPFANTIFEDDDVDFFSLDDGNALVSGSDNKFPGNGKLDVGDVLTAVVEVTRLVDALGIQDSRLVQDLGVELTGVSVIQVTSKIDIGGGNFRIGFGAADPSLWPTINNADDVAAAYPGTMLALWEDDTPDLDVSSCSSFDDCVTKASDGELWQVDGIPDDGEMGYDADNEWFYFGTDDGTAVSGIGGATKVGFANFIMSVLYQDGAPNPADPTGELDPDDEYILNDKECPAIVGFACAGDGFGDMIGSVDILGGQNLTNDAFARSDADWQKNRVPEPAALALLGAGLLGFGGARKLRKKQA